MKSFAKAVELQKVLRIQKNKSVPLSVVINFKIP